MLSSKGIAILALTLLSLACCVFIEHQDEQIHDKIIKSFMDGSKKELFKVYHHLYNKQYDLYSEEGLMRFKIFKDSVRFIKEHNSQNLTSTLGLNDFADMTDEEFKEMYLTGDLTDFEDFPEQEFLYEEASESLTSYPNVDHSGNMSPIRNQKKCGSCWSFSSLATIEGNYNKQFGGPKFYLSPQDLIDCWAWDPTKGACGGRKVGSAYKYITNNGVTFENFDPYVSGKTSKESVCLTNIKKVKMVESFERCLDCTKDQFYSLLAKGPITTAMDASDKKLKFHKEGTILTELSCTEPNHAVVVIAHKDGVLTVRNSWGKRWGENGNFRINVPKNNCFLETIATLPKVRKVDNIPPMPKIID